MATTSRSRLTTLVQLAKLKRIEEIEKCLKSAEACQSTDGLDAVWINWCEILYFQVEALRIASVSLVAAVKARRLEIELHMDKSCLGCSNRKA